MRHIGRLPRRVKKKRAKLLENAMHMLENFDDPQSDELLRLSQEDLYQMKRTHMVDLSERRKMYSDMLEEEDAVLRKARLQLAEGKVAGTGAQVYFDKRMMNLHRRRLTNMQADIQFEVLEMQANRDLKEDEETRRKRRAKQFKLAEYDESQGFPDEPYEIPDNIEYTSTTVSPESLEAKIDMELNMIKERTAGRTKAFQDSWKKLWRQEGASKDRPASLSFWTKLLKRYPSIRKRWTDDDRCWRSPEEWHENYNTSLGPRLTDGVLIPTKLVEKAELTAFGVWSEATPVATDVVVHHISNLLSPPTISPSIWTYPGNIVCLMNRRGALDLYRRHELDRDVWWIGRLKLAQAFLDKIPPGMDLSAIQVGDNHLAIFSFQRFFQASTLNPYGACWMVPKAELSEGSNVVTLPHVPLRYYKPISARGILFVLGYNDPSDLHYQLLSLKWKDGAPSEWIETDMSHTLPVVWTDQVRLQDYPESIYLEGTASVCVAQDESAIFVTAPTSEGQAVLVIDTHTWDFHVEKSNVPPVWGCSLIHDNINHCLILAGGIGHMSPEPILRYFNLADSSWSVQSKPNSAPLPAYAATFPIGHGSHAIVGGFWRTGHKKFNLQPTASIFALHATPAAEFQHEYLHTMYSPRYGEQIRSADEDDAVAGTPLAEDTAEPEFDA